MIQKCFTWVTTIVENIFFAGVFYGWANMYPILEEEKYFTDNCPNTTVINNETNTTISSEATCKSQAEAFSLVFTIAGSVGLFSAMLTGALLDRFGMWFTRTLLVQLAIISYIIVAASNADSSYVLYFAFPLINLTGFGMLLLNSQMANLFSKLRGSYATSSVGAFSSAPLVYLIMSQLYHYTGLSFQFICYFYACLLMLMNVRTFTLTPKRSVPFAVTQRYKYGYKELCPLTSDDAEPIDEESSSKEDINKEQVKQQKPAINPDDATFKECMCKVYTYTGMFAVTIVQFSTSFYVSSLNMFFKELLADASSKITIVKYTNIFGIIQCSSIVFAPVNGLIIDLCTRRFSRTTDPHYAAIKACAIGFIMSSCFMIGMSACLLIPNLELQIVGMLMQMLARTCFFGIWTVFLTLIFPSQHYGKLFGIFSVACGVVMAMQYPITLLLTRVLDGDFTTLNTVLLIFSFLTLVHPFYLLYYLSQRTTSVAGRNTGQVVDGIEMDDEPSHNLLKQNS